jgi:hypothetical protein
LALARCARAWIANGFGAAGNNDLLTIYNFVGMPLNILIDLGAY